ncbi:MAG TPA: HAMP domain-containing protein, partial [Trebonia sp.]
MRSLRLLSERTSLRTKLITAVLALVIAALAVISIASVLILGPYLYTQRDADLQRDLIYQLHGGGNAEGQFPAGRVITPDAGIIAAVQVPGQQLTPTSAQFGGFGTSTQSTLALPALPAGNWTNPNDPVTLTQQGQSGGDTWRVMGITVPAVTSAGTQVNAPLLVAVDLGPVSQEIHRLIAIELGVSTAIVIVVAVAGVAIVRTNLRPLNDIELTAGQIAAGHLNHRIAERDPRTEIGSLGRSLNAMLSQIETAFHAQRESEEAAHRSEERMRRFIADASHELRTPLTTLRGFAEFYRQRGG